MECFTGLYVGYTRVSDTFVCTDVFFLPQGGSLLFHQCLVMLREGTVVHFHKHLIDPSTQYSTDWGGN